MLGLKVWKIQGQSMAPTIPSGCYVLAVKWLASFKIKVGHKLIIDHPKYGVIVKTVALIDKNGFIWSKGENIQSVSVEELGPSSAEQILGRVIKNFKKT